MKQVKLTLLFLMINFGGLAIGSWLMDNGPMTDWYINLNQAPWSPPGWVFGAAWTTIMICFSIYMAYLFTPYWFVGVGMLSLYGMSVYGSYYLFNQHLILSDVSWIIIVITIVGMHSIFNRFILELL